MAYYIRANRSETPVLGQRRPTINEYFLSSYTLNIYQGCEFGCQYCDEWVYHSRPLNEAISVPLDLPQRLATELPTISRGDLVGITALSDAYQPVERTYRITRQVLQLFADVGQPCLVLTKGIGILEDIPLLQQIHERSLAIVMMSILTVAPALASRLEGKAPAPALRLDALAKLKRAGLPVGVALMPILPYVNDTNYTLAGLLRQCADIGVDFVVWDFLHIPDRSHYNRINEILVRIGSYPASYYRDVYGDQVLPNRIYCNRTNADLLQRCDMFNLDTRAPHSIFAGRLAPANEAALLLKQVAFRDMVQGRENIATLHRDLADLVYRGEATSDQLRASNLYPTLQEILGI
jgi:DNA repair photolyase